MEFINFIEVVVKKVRESNKFAADVHVSEKYVLNGKKKTGISLETDSMDVSPVVYLDSLYEQVCSGDKTLDEVVEEVLEVFREKKVPDVIRYEKIQCFEKVRERIGFFMINRELNKELLKNVPHIRFLDLALVFEVHLETGEQERLTVRVSNALAEQWGMDAHRLYVEAVKAGENNIDHMRMIGIMDMLDDLKGTKRLLEDTGEEENPLYVLGNDTGVYGAAMIAVPGVLKKAASELDSDLYVIPSSVHETLITPLCGMGPDSADVICAIIKEVNATQVAENEILSDRLYVYDRKSDILKPTDPRDIWEEVGWKVGCLPA